MRGPAVLFGLLMLTGCTQAPPPIVKAKAVAVAAQAAAFTLPTDPPPAASDPAAKAVIDAALKAHTDGQPAKLDGLKTARKVVAGVLTGPNGPVGNEWQFTWQWPDKWKTKMAITGSPPVGIRRVGGSAWLSVGGAPEQPISGPDLVGVLAETFAECLVVLLPLADPAAVFGPGAAATVRGKPAVGVRVSGAGWPTTVCHFDPDTRRLVQVSYAGSEGGVATTKEVTVLAEKAFNGVTLPERLGIRWNGQEKGDWTLRELTFPVPVEARLFDGP